MLSQNHPNPFSGSTSIRYALPKPGDVTICIYNVRGQEIAVVLDEEPREAGYHVQVWDGKNKYGRDVSGGVYFYQLRVGSSRNTKKMLLVE
jgi:flagellar hook assembly protein FlgD